MPSCPLKTPRTDAEMMERVGEKNNTHNFRVHLGAQPSPRIGSVGINGPISYDGCHVLGGGRIT